MRRPSAILICLTAAVCAAPVVAQQFYSKDWVAKKAPALDAREGHLINAELPPSLEKLHGQVVWLEFTFLN